MGSVTHTCEKRTYDQGKLPIAIATAPGTVEKPDSTTIMLPTNSRGFPMAPFPIRSPGHCRATSRPVFHIPAAAAEREALPGYPVIG